MSKSRICIIWIISYKSYKNRTAFPVSIAYSVSDLVLVPITSTDIDNKYFVCHVYFLLIHFVQHLYCTICTDFKISRVTKEANTYDNVSFQSKTFLGLHERIFETSTFTEGGPFSTSMLILLYNKL